MNGTVCYRILVDSLGHRLCVCEWRDLTWALGVKQFAIFICMDMLKGAAYFLLSCWWWFTACCIIGTICFVPSSGSLVSAPIPTPQARQWNHPTPTPPPTWLCSWQDFKTQSLTAVTVIDVDHFYRALSSILEQTYCTLVLPDWMSDCSFFTVFEHPPPEWSRCSAVWFLQTVCQSWSVLFFSPWQEGVEAPLGLPEGGGGAKFLLLLGG